MQRATIAVISAMMLVIVTITPSSAYGIPGSFETTTGNTIPYSSYEGKYLLVDAFRTTCPACQSFHPTLNQIVDRYQENLTVISIAYQTVDNINTLKQWEIDYPSQSLVGLDYNFGNRYGVSATPTTILFDKNGNEVHRWVGDQPLSEFTPIMDRIVDGADESDVSDIINDGDSSPQGSLIGDLFGNQLFQLGMLTIIGILIFLKVSSPKKV